MIWTALSIDGQIVDEVIGKKIQKLLNHNEVVFASARPIRDILSLLPASLHQCLMVGCNGAMAYKNGQFIFSHTFDDVVSEKFINFFMQENIPYILDSNWHYAISSTPHHFHDYIRQLSRQEKSLSSILEDGVAKILILDGNFREKIDNFLKQNKYRFNVHHHKYDNVFDITPQKEDKYLALKRLGIDFCTAIAFGNDENDHTMLDNAKISIYLGDLLEYPRATYYCDIKDIPKFLDTITLA